MLFILRICLYSNLLKLVVVNIRIKKILFNSSILIDFMYLIYLIFFIDCFLICY